MEQNWSSVYSTNNPIEAELVKALLREHGIEAVELNRRDTCHGNFGSIEVYCHATQVLEALHLIKNRKHE